MLAVTAQVLAVDAAADLVQPTFVCTHCGAAMIITQTILRGQAIRAPPPLQERR